MNPFSEADQGYEAAIIRGSARANLDFQLVIDLNDDSKYELLVNLQNATLEVAEMKAYFQSDLVVTDFQYKDGDEEHKSILDPLIELFTNSLNKKAGELLGLSLAKPTSQDLSESKLYTYDGFLMI